MCPHPNAIYCFLSWIVLLLHIFSCVCHWTMWCLMSSSSKLYIYIYIKKSFLWNVLKVVRINHRFFLQSIIKIGTPSQYFLKHFEFELDFLKVYLQMNDFHLLQIMRFRFFLLCLNSLRNPRVYSCWKWHDISILWWVT